MGGGEGAEDVYKRQALYAEKLRARLGERVLGPVTPPITRVQTVSYTHLDVYKRQAFNPIDPFVMIKSVFMFMVYSAYIVITDNIR